MATVNTNYLRVQNAKNLVATLPGSYLFIGKPNPWESGDTVAPVPNNNHSEYYETYDHILSMKRLDADDVYPMLRRLKWSGGVTYDMYRHDYSERNRSFSGARNLYSSNFYVINQAYSVYVCLDNNNNSQSMVEPSFVGADPFYTSDGYQWLLVYSIPVSVINSSATENYIPVIQNRVNVLGAGELNTIVIDSPGSNYTNSPAGVGNQLPYYYCNIVGDGTGAVGRVRVKNGSVTSAEVVRPGSGYTNAKLIFKSNKVYATLVDLDAGMNALNPLGSNDFQSTVIISPPGGWGSDIESQLGATSVGVFTRISASENDFIPTEFRQVGILNDPTTTQTNPTTIATYDSIVTTAVSGPGEFTIGETISQTVDIGGVDHIAKGEVVNWDSTNMVVSYIQDYHNHTDIDGNLYPFSGDGQISGEDSQNLVDVDITNSTTINDRDFVNGYSVQEVQKYTGSLLYLSNNSPITRDPNQSEKVSLLITY